MIRSAYLLLILWQPLWHGWLVPERWLLGALFGVVLLLPVFGIIKQRQRAQAVGGFLVLFFLVIAIMEVWAGVGQRYFAAVQLLLCLAYLLPLMQQGWQRKKMARANFRETSE